MSSSLNSNQEVNWWLGWGLMRGQPTNSGAQPRFLMCRPQYYAVSYSINPWMDPQDWAAQGSDLGEAAHREWAALHAALIDKGATIECVDPKPDLPDLVFTANAAIVLDGKALLSRFRHPERKPEEPVFADALQAQAGLDAVETLPGDIDSRGRRRLHLGCRIAANSGWAAAIAPIARLRMLSRIISAVECVALELASAELLSPRHGVLRAAHGRRDLLPKRVYRGGAARDRGAGRASEARRARSRRSGAILSQCRIVRSLPGAVVVHRRIPAQGRRARLHGADHAASGLLAERRLCLLSDAQARPPLLRRRAAQRASQGPSV